MLYGLKEIKKIDSKIPYVIIVEGYIDVLMLNQFDIKYTLGLMGTNISDSHIKFLYNISEKIIICFDGDKTGRESSWKALIKISKYLCENRQLYFLFLPKGEDPDSLIKKIGKKEFSILIKNSVPMSKFFFSYLVSRVNMSFIDSKKKLAYLAIPIIKKIPNKILQLYLREKLGEKLEIIKEYNLNKLFPIKIENKKSKINKLNIVNKLTSMLIQYPNLYKFVKVTKILKKINIFETNIFIKIVEVCKNLPKIKTESLLSIFSEFHFFKYLKKLSKYDHMVNKNNIELTFIEYLISMLEHILFYLQKKLILIEKMYGINLKYKKIVWKLSKELKNIL
ncbi:MAG: toprim domain-containing protein [Enterobacteriaceae bacterium]